MNRVWGAGPAATAVGLFFLACQASALTLYVAPNGNDAWTGLRATADGLRTDGPLASLEGARNRVRQLRATGPVKEPVTVVLAPGEYVLERPVVFTPEDSGTAESPVTYTAASGGAVVFFGGRRLAPFAADKDGVWRTQATWAKDRGLRFEQLYVNGKRATRARSPNRFYAYMQKAAPYGVDPLTGKPADLGNRAFIAAPSDLAPLVGKSREALSDVEITVYHSWEVSHARVQAVEPETGRMVVTGSSPWSFFSWGPYLPRYHIENLKEALDEPGEWYLDAEGVVSYLPLSGEKPGRTEAVAPLTDAFLRFKGDALKGQWISNLTFSGVTFAYAAYRLPAGGQGDGQAAVNQPAAVELDGARSVAFRDCSFGHIGAHGIWFRKGCRECVVERCRVFDLGGGAVRIGDSSWSKEELPDKLTGRIVIDNNILHGGGRFFAGATGVWIGHASDVQVTHNDIADFFYTGISMGWTWGYAETVTHRNTVAFNHIHHLGWGVLSDMGGIYTLGRSEGTCLSNNVIHDVYSYDFTGRGGWGLYTDEGSAGMVYENNLVYRTKTGLVHQHYGKDNVFRNNIFAFSMNGQVQRSRIEDHTAFYFTNNIVYWDNDSAAFWRGYPSVSTVKDVVVDGNTYWNPQGIASNAFNGGTWETWRSQGQDAHSQIADPLFRAPSKGDFRLKRASPALKLGFKPFDASQAGVYGARAWRKLAASDVYPEVAFAPDPERYVVRRLSENFDGLPLRAPFPDVESHVENKGDGIFVTDEAAFSGKQSLKVQDSPNLEQFYNPHFTFSCWFTNAVLENRFAVRMQAGAEFFTEWRDYNSCKGGANAYATGPFLMFSGGKITARTRVAKPDGSWQTESRFIADLPADVWARVTVCGGVGPKNSTTWSVRVERAGVPTAEVSGLSFNDDLFLAMGWLGFCSTAQRDTSYYIDDFVFGEKPK